LLFRSHCHGTSRSATKETAELAYDKVPASKKSVEGFIMRSGKQELTKGGGKNCLDSPLLVPECTEYLILEQPFGFQIFTPLNKACQNSTGIGESPFAFSSSL
jgi:hypothetical protein